jgi:hypothetical protein
MHNVCAFRHDLGFNWQPAENSRRCAACGDESARSCGALAPNRFKDFW